MYYLTKGEDPTDFGFKLKGVNEILETDIPISKEIHDEFMKQQCEGKQFKIKNPEGKSFTDIFEEFIPKTIILKSKLDERIDNIEKENELIKMAIDDVIFSQGGLL